MSKPHRVQLSRKKGWRKPKNTVVVSRPTKFGNPFWLGRGSRHAATVKYRHKLEGELALMRSGAKAKNKYFRRIAEDIPELRGRNLGCWCPLDIPDSDCHAGVLLEFANK